MKSNKNCYNKKKKCKESNNKWISKKNNIFLRKDCFTNKKMSKWNTFKNNIQNPKRMNNKCNFKIKSQNILLKDKMKDNMNHNNNNSNYCNNKNKNNSNSKNNNNNNNININNNNSKNPNNNHNHNKVMIIMIINNFYKESL